MKILGFLSTLLFSCSNSPEKLQEKETIFHADALKQDSVKINSHAGEMKITLRDPIPVFGYRYIISGDFDGVGC